jgi:hypothetical protein
MQLDTLTRHEYRIEKKSCRIRNQRRILILILILIRKKTVQVHNTARKCKNVHVVNFLKGVVTVSGKYHKIEMKCCTALENPLQEVARVSMYAFQTG